jgi:hypothetical protein
MNFQSLIKNTKTISKVSTLVIFLALIRCISEPFRLQYLSSSNLPFSDIKPFLVGSLVASVGLLLMTILSYYGKHKTIIAICIVTIIVLLILKKVYYIH